MNGLFFSISVCSYTACMLVRISKSALIKALSYLVHNLATPPYSPAALDPKLDEGGLQIFSERSEADSVYGKLSGRLLPVCNRWPCGQASGAKG